MKAYVLRVLIAFDRFCNALLSNYDGADHETISHHWFDTKDKSALSRFGIWCLEKLDPDHGKQAEVVDTDYKDVENGHIGDH